MTLSAALKARLLSAALITAATNGRIGSSGQLQGLPAIRIQVVADPRPQYFKGFQRVRPSTVQVDVWAADETSATELRDLVIATLVPADATTDVRFQRAMVAGVRGTAEQQDARAQRARAELWRESIDFIFTHNAS